MFRQLNIDNHEDRLISFDQAQVKSTQQDYRDSVYENGLYSAQTVQAGTNMSSAENKLLSDQRDYDQYLSASGQSTVPLQ